MAQAHVQFVLKSILWLSLGAAGIAWISSGQSGRPLSAQGSKDAAPPVDQAVKYNPQTAIKLEQMDVFVLQVRACMREFQVALLRNGVRDREQLKSAAITTCSQIASKLPSDMKEIAVAGFPLLAEQELDALLTYRNK